MTPFSNPFAFAISSAFFLSIEKEHAPESPTQSGFAARLVELTELLERKAGERMASAAIRDGDAIAWVETARGMLVHRVALDEESVVRYQIVAPTEWNFHPRGALVVELETLCVGDRTALERRVELLVQSLDPCVAYGIEIGHA